MQSRVIAALIYLCNGKPVWKRLSIMKVILLQLEDKICPAVKDIVPTGDEAC